jgi:hypothetical protein
MAKTATQPNEPATSEVGRYAEGLSNAHEVDRASAVLAEYYRCVPEHSRFSAIGQTASHPGYFRFGSDTVCYGRLSSGTVSRRPAGNLEDALESVIATAEGIELRFDAREVVSNLRCERYAAHFRQEGQILNEILRKAYYLIRPYLGVSIRRHLQKVHLRGWQGIGFPAWPLDTTVDRIHRKLLALQLRMQGLEKIPFIWFWPDGLSSCVIITHDVESETGRDFCSRLMDLDDSFGFRSAFQIVPENRYSVAASFLESIRNRGFEVNVHDLKHDGRLYADHAEFLVRAKRINTYVRQFGAEGFRSGILYRNADWYDAFDFSYDMSLPNVAHLDPQRGGCCTVMPFFIGKLVELPVTCTQDYTLFQILGDYTLDLWKKQIAVIRKEHGLVTFIVHPDYIIEQQAQDTYKALLGHLAHLRADDGMWCALPRDVASWWRQRSQMELVNENGAWRVVGLGQERARVAYASLDGDTVSYRLAD